MSAARQCEKCGVLFKQSQRGCVTLGEFCVTSGKDSGEMDTWSDVDLCFECSKEVLKAVGSACLHDGTPVDQLYANPE